MPIALPLINKDQAKFECTFGRGCEGVCCREGRPLIYEDEIANLTKNLDKFLPYLRPEARAIVQKSGFLEPRRRRLGERMARVSKGWCVFFNQGCVLHQVGAEEGDKFRYKPAPCSLFPLEQDDDDNWYVRQHGYQGEQWDLFCLAPGLSQVPAAESLKEEAAFAERQMAAKKR